MPPYDDPEIVVAVFIFNGGEGSQWAAPVACHVMAAYLGVGQYANGLTPTEWEAEIQAKSTCRTFIQDENRFLCLLWNRLNLRRNRILLLIHC